MNTSDSNIKALEPELLWGSQALENSSGTDHYTYLCRYIMLLYLTEAR